MDIHKPKPWHGVREFLKEYLIIVVGVLTALGAEQLVEAMHWRHVVEQQRDALNTNAAYVQDAMMYRSDIEPCVSRKLDQVEEVIRRHDRGQALGVAGSVGRPQYILAKFTAWDLAIADQSISHMSMKEKAAYLVLAATIQNYEGTRLDERAAWRDLQILDDADRLSASEWADARRAAKLARDIDRNMRQSLNAEDWLRPFKAFELPELGKRAPWTQSPFIQRLCAPLIAGAGASAIPGGG